MPTYICTTYNMYVIVDGRQLQSHRALTLIPLRIPACIPQKFEQCEKNSLVVLVLPNPARLEPVAAGEEPFQLLRGGGDPIRPQKQSGNPTIGSNERHVHSYAGIIKIQRRRLKQRGGRDVEVEPIPRTCDPHARMQHARLRACCRCFSRCCARVLRL